MPFGSVMRRVNIPVYMIHNSLDPEDYLFLFDFEVFTDRAGRGFLTRPRLMIWAGRDDFDRHRFARQFREVFVTEFDKMRAELRKARRWKLDSNWLAPVALLAYWILYLALSPISNRRIARRELKLENEIEETQGKVDHLLSVAEVRLHAELFAHARRSTDGAGGDHVDREAWPLPAYVGEHIYDEKSGAWW
ncbi:hypothetical protein POI8812_02981 [Pontivivens insulae]|uniref:Uncharacterized protein n=1 Tax=Pontivivens insulae TaxID=1639689 RepID=A0A2R8AEE5_9RHOB|nr:hypothetical protein DFR53_2595 [Pontivivens insulae]SPF30641.1 hypothetical protein POI8812_02981 [Pontivivens insulae]